MKRAGGYRRHRQQGGFILLMVLGLLVVLVMLAAAAATTSDRVRTDQQLDDTRLAGQLNAHSTRATLLYLLATQRMTFAGLTVDNRVVYSQSELREKQRGDVVRTLMPVGNELRMNGTVYSGIGGSRFALQADNGLFNIDVQPAMRQDWLTGLKASPDEQAQLVDTLLDYQDPDNFQRLNGAEKDQYIQKDMQPPPNRTLVSPLELRRVMGWGKVLAPLDDDALMHTITVSRTGPLDVNAAPPAVLGLLPGVTQPMAERVVAMRDVEAFNEEAAVYTLLPTLDPENNLISLYPSASGTIELWPDAGTGATLVHWTLTPFDDGGSPWHIDYEFRLPAGEGGGNAPARQPQTPLLDDPQTAHPG